MVIAEAILIRTSAKQVPCLHSVVPRYLKLAISNFWLSMLIICTDDARVVGHDPAFFCADIHSICRCSVYESKELTASVLKKKKKVQKHTRGYIEC